MSGRRRHVGSRDQPKRNNCLGVFGLSLYTTERELEKEFSKFGPLQKVPVVALGKLVGHGDGRHHVSAPASWNSHHPLHRPG